MFFRFGNNSSFLTNYRGYVAKEWAGYYFAYDFFKSEYKKRKGASHVDIHEFDQRLLAEIQRVHRFLMSVVESVDSDLTTVTNTIDQLHANPTDQTDRNIELSLRMLFHKINQCDEFFKLNHFAISKVCKKLEKLPLKDGLTEQLSLSQPTSETLGGLEMSEYHRSEPEAEVLLDDHHQTESDKNRRLFLGGSASGAYFYESYYSSAQRIDEVKQRCIDIYTIKFRRTYAQLAHYELQYIKNKDRDFKNTRFLIGAKLGLTCCIFLWIAVDTMTTVNTLDFWNQPGLYVYTTIGNMLIYRLGWAFQVYVWSKFDVNFIAALQLSNIRPNMVLVMDQTAMLLLIYSVNLLVFFKANSEGTVLYNTFLSYASPFFLIVAAVCYQMYEYFYLNNSQRSSCGVFTQRVVMNCFRAPFVPVRFRDVYAADVLTSFTRIIADSLYASCWVLSGTFSSPRHHTDTQNIATDFGSDYLQCTGSDMHLIAGLAQLIPLLIRALQCLRSCKDSGWKMYPQGYNTAKYVLSMGVVFVSLVVEVQGGHRYLYAIVVITALYKWWWDVAMDWGLWEIMPRGVEDLLRVDRYLQAKMYLRHLIMYPSLLSYHFCVLVDLFLRFAWVLSLLPPSATGGLVGYQMSFFLGSLEIMRRSMWGSFRIEWEHVKLLKQGHPGFLSTPVIREYGGSSNSEKVDAIDDIAPSVIDDVL